MTACAICGKDAPAKVNRSWERRRYCGQVCYIEGARRRYHARKGTPAGDGPRGFTFTRINFPRVGLYLGSKPKPCEEPRGVDDVDRRVFCRRYPNCLEHACGEGWKGWSCKGCPVEQPITPDQYHTDLPGLATLLKAMDITRRHRP